MAVILAGLSLIGYSKFQDVQNTADKAETTLRNAQQNVDNIVDRSKQVDIQLAQLKEQLQANDIQISSLNTTVRNLAEKLNFDSSDSGLSASQQRKLRDAEADFLRYFGGLGYTLKTTGVRFSTKTIPNGLSYYEPSTNSIVIKRNIVDDTTILLHEYGHRILYSSLAFDAVNGAPAWKYSAMPIEFGLDDYFVASSRNDPVIGALAAKLWPDSGMPIKLANNERITITQLGDHADQELIQRLGPAWGGAFWELRQAVGQDIADKILYEGWRTLVHQDQALVAHSFITSVTAQLNSAAGKPAVKTFRDILARRGINAGDLPNAE